jgi:phosphonate transport system substrate-binding protein
VDADFHSVFIANRRSGLKPFTETAGLSALAGHSLTFGSETSTSGRLMPQYFMDQASLGLGRLKGKPGFSGSHDKTIALVAAGTFEVGPVNELVWKAAVEDGKVDVSDLVVLWTSPGYADYNWTVRPDLDQRLGAGTTQKLTDTLLGLDISKPDDKAVLDLFEATKFIPTDNAAYGKIETVAQRIGLLG